MGTSHEVLLRFFYVTSVALVAGVSFWLNHRCPRHFFAGWPWGYLCLLGVAVLDTAAVVLPWRQPLFVGLSAVFTLAALFFARVGFELRGRPPPRWLAGAAASIFASALGLRLAGAGDLALVPPVGASALVFLWLGHLFFVESLARGRSLSRVLSVLLVLKGLSLCAYPLLVGLGTVWLGYWIDAVLHLLVGMSMLVLVLERSAEELQLLVESNVNHSFFLANPRGEIASWNSGARRLHGFGGSEVVGRPLSVLRAGDSAADEPIEGPAGGPGCAEYEGWHWRKDGSRFWARVSISPIRDPAHDVRELAVLVHDLSDRRALEEERTRLSVAVRQSVEGIVVTDAEGRIEYFNPAFERGRRPGAVGLLGRRLQELDLGGETEGLAEAIARREGWQGRVAHGEEGGPAVVEDLVLSPARDASGAVSLFVLRVHDVSREVALQEQVHAARKMEEIGRLAGGIAHDFGNLLAIIVSYNHVLKKRAGTDPAVRTSAEAIGRATGRADRLIRQLLAFCRQDVRVPQTVELNPFVSQFAGRARRIVREDIVLRSSLDPEVGHIHVDPEQLEQALMNLVLNARDAMPEGGTLVFETRALSLGGGEEGWSQPPEAGPYAGLSVGDDGLGMSPETRGRIFEPFFTTKQGGKATGIGLSVVEAFVRDAGGAIQVESEPGRGTTFRLSFPTVEAGARPPLLEPVPEAEGAPVTVLVVDDEPLLGQVVQRILEERQFRTLGARGGAEALELVRRHPGAIDLLLTDVNMPGMSGPALAEAMRGLRPGIRTLFMSGHTDDPVVRRVRESGGGFIAKPFLPEELLRRVCGLASVERSGHEESDGPS